MSVVQGTNRPDPPESAAGPVAKGKVPVAGLEEPPEGAHDARAKENKSQEETTHSLVPFR